MTGEQLASLRGKLGLSQKQFAELIGMSESAIAMVEANHRKMSTNMRAKIAANITINDDVIDFLKSTEKLKHINPK